MDSPQCASIRCQNWRSPGALAEDLGAMGGGQDSMLVSLSVRFCDLCRHEPATRQLEDAGIARQRGHGATDEQRRFSVGLVLEVLDVGDHTFGQDKSWIKR